MQKDGAKGRVETRHANRRSDVPALCKTKRGEAMSDIEKIIEKHRIRMMKVLPGAGYVKENATAAFIMADAVREAVEAERGRQVAEKAELHVLLGKLVKDACAVGGSPELSPDDWKRACLLSGHYCEPYLSAFPATDSEGAGYECRECRHINNTPGFCRNCGFDAYPTL